VALDAGVRAARPRALRHQSPSSRPGRGLDRRVQPRPQTLLDRHAQPDRLRAHAGRRRPAAHTAGGRGMTPAPGATTIVPSSPASRPSPPGGLRPALTPTAGDTGMHRSGAGNKEDQQNKIHL